MIKQISTQFNGNAHWLFTGNGPMFFNNPDKNLTNQSLNLMKIQGEISAGKPIESLNAFDGLIPVPDQILRSPDKYNILKINGMSMEPEIHHNDVAIISISSDWSEMEGKIGAVMISGEITLKKISSNGKFLIPFNHNFDIIDIQNEPDINLIGYLSYIIRKFS
jgi:SOS-response transcriptional repressor LexA